MKNAQLFTILISCLFLGCKLPTVGYFSTQPFIIAYKTNIDKPLTIVIDENIKDSFVIKSAGINKMTVIQFRHTLEDGLQNTFKNTYTDLQVGNSFSQKGISLVLVKVTPDWNKKSSRTVVTGNSGNMQSNTSYELDTKISYQGIIYSDGEKKGVIEGTIFSEKSTFQAKQTPEVFKDGVKVMCEDIYKKITNYK